jgi:hypothetical protein
VTAELIEMGQYYFLGRCTESAGILAVSFKLYILYYLIFFFFPVSTNSKYNLKAIIDDDHPEAKNDPNYDNSDDEDLDQKLADWEESKFIDIHPK